MRRQSPSHANEVIFFEIRSDNGVGLVADLAHQVVHKAGVATAGNHVQDATGDGRVIEKTQQQPQDSPLRSLGEGVDYCRHRRMGHVAEDLSQDHVFRTGQQEEALDHFAALMLAEAMDGRLQAAQHVAANHLGIAAIARIASARQFVAERAYQVQCGLRG